MEVAADSVIDEALLELGLSSCLVSEDYIIIPTPFHLIIMNHHVSERGFLQEWSSVLDHDAQCLSV